MNELLITLQDYDCVAILDRFLFKAPRDEDGVTLWRQLIALVCQANLQSAANLATNILRDEQGRRIAQVSVQHHQTLILRLRYHDEALIGDEFALLPIHRRVQLEAGPLHQHVRLRLRIYDDDFTKVSSLAQILCAIHHEFGGFIDCSIDGIEMTPNLALALLALRLEEFDDIADTLIGRISQQDPPQDLV
jgi:hypothetical protein